MAVFELSRMEEPNLYRKGTLTLVKMGQIYQNEVEEL